jgi:FAD dependent oxidoreductase
MQQWSHGRVVLVLLSMLLAVARLYVMLAFRVDNSSTTIDTTVQVLNLSYRTVINTVERTMTRSVRKKRNKTIRYQHCSIVIFGSTPAGIVSAIAASRTINHHFQNDRDKMKNNVIIDDSKNVCGNEDSTYYNSTGECYQKPHLICLLSVLQAHIGGMMSSGLGITDIGEYPNRTIGGIAKEFFIRNTEHYHQQLRNRSSNGSDAASTAEAVNNNNTYPINKYSTYNGTLRYNVESSVAESIFRKMLQEASHNVLLIEDSGDIVKVDYHKHDKGRRISCIRTRNSKDSYYKVCGNVFIDASYEGDLLELANISYAIGRESPALYNESYNGNIRHNDAHQFVVPVSPYRYSNASTKFQFKKNPQKSNHRTKKEPLLTFLMTGYDDGQKGSENDIKVQSYNFRLCVTNSSYHRVPFPKPLNYQVERWELFRRYIIALNQQNLTESTIKVPTPNTHPLFPVETDIRNKGDKLPFPIHKYDCNNGGAISTDFVGGSWKYPKSSGLQRKLIWEKHKQYILEFFWFLSKETVVPLAIRNEMLSWGLCNDEYIDTEYWPPQLYVREARRMIGDFVWTQNDVNEQQKQRQTRIRKNDVNSESIVDVLGIDSIGLGSYNYDSHTVQRFACTNCSLSFSSSQITTFAWNEGDLERSPNVIYQIPIDIVFPKVIEAWNLLSVTCPSTSHVTYNTIRMEPQFMILGHACGIIAALDCFSIPSTSTPIQNISRIKVHDELTRSGQALS